MLAKISNTACIGRWCLRVRFKHIYKAYFPTLNLSIPEHYNIIKYHVNKKRNT